MKTMKSKTMWLILSLMITLTPSIFADYTWAKQEIAGPSITKNLMDISMSTDGQTIATCAYGDYVYVSIDYGATWSQKSPAGSIKNWGNIVVSNDGTKMIAIAKDGDFLYVSPDTGSTWTKKELDGSGVGAYWRNMQTSKDRSKVIACYDSNTAGGISACYVTSDWGTTWTKLTVNNTTYPLSACAISDDGQTVAAFAQNTTGYVSKDGGTTWVKSLTATLNWNKAQIYDTDLYVCALNTSFYKNDGIGWSAFGPNATLQWSCINKVNDTQIFATANVNGVYVSNDNGVNWVKYDPSGTNTSSSMKYKAIAASSDGQNVAVVTSYGYVYTSMNNITKTLTTFTLVANANNGGVVSNGITTSSSITMTVTPTDTVSLDAIPTEGYSFTGWTKSTSQSAMNKRLGDAPVTYNPYTVSGVNSNTTLTANFTLNTFTVTFLTTGDGTLSGATTQTIPYNGSSTTVTATPNSGYSFLNWIDASGAIYSTMATITLTNVKSDMSLTANYTLIPIYYTVTFNVNGVGGSINGVISQSVLKGSNTTSVTAIANTGYTFNNWSDGDKNVSKNVMNVQSDLTFGANFTEIPVYFSVTFSSDAGGTLSGTVTQSVLKGSDATSVSAIANDGYVFNGWSGDVSGTTNPLTITNVTKNMKVNATFKSVTYNVFFIADAGGCVRGLVNQNIPFGGSTIAVSSCPNSGYDFSGWDGDYIGVDNPIVINNVTQDMTIIARFDKQEDDCDGGAEKIHILMKNGNKDSHTGLGCSDDNGKSMTLIRAKNMPIAQIANYIAAYGDVQVVVDGTVFTFKSSTIKRLGKRNVYSYTRGGALKMTIDLDRKQWSFKTNQNSLLPIDNSNGVQFTLICKSKKVLDKNYKMDEKSNRNITLLKYSGEKSKK